MGQTISYCKSGSDASIGSFEPHMSEYRKWRLPGSAPKTLLWRNDDNTTGSKATASTGLSSSKTSMSPPSPLGSSSGTIDTIVNGNDNDNGNENIMTSSTRHTKHVHQPLALRYTASTRNLHNPTREAAATTTTTTITIPSTKAYRPRVDSEPTVLPAHQQQMQQLQNQQQRTRTQHTVRNNPNRRKVQSYTQRGAAPTPADRRSNPVKFPRKRHTHTYGCPKNPLQSNDISDHLNASSSSYESPQNASYLERMYDSRTWEMYRRITTHREKVDAFNAANASAKQENDDDRNSTNQTYMSDPVQRVTNSSTMVGGVDYDNFYDPATDDDDDSRGRGAFLLEDHSAPPYHHHRCDNGQHHQNFGCDPSGQRYHHDNNHAETYSEWEHMDGDDVGNGDSNNRSTNSNGGQHETIFLFDF